MFVLAVTWTESIRSDLGLINIVLLRCAAVKLTSVRHKLLLLILCFELPMHR